MKKAKKTLVPKPRNPYALLAAKRKAGCHGKNSKALRRKVNAAQGKCYEG